MPSARNSNAPLPPVNRHDTDHWKEDSEASVDYYNDWFLRFAPPSFRKARDAAARKVAEAYLRTDHVRADRRGIPVNTARRFLLDCTGAEVETLPTAVRTYLAKGSNTTGKTKHGGGLQKMEPSELGDLDVSALSDWMLDHAAYYPQRQPEQLLLAMEAKKQYDQKNSP